MTRTLYFEDIAPGDCYAFAGTRVTAEQIKTFAARYDPQPFHLDESAAHESIFEGLAASGWHTAALTIKIITRDPRQRFASLGSPGFDNLRWRKPVRPGDHLRVQATARELTPCERHPERGTVRFHVETLDQADDVVMSLETLVFVARRPEDETCD